MSRFSLPAVAGVWVVLSVAAPSLFAPQPGFGFQQTAPAITCDACHAGKPAQVTRVTSDDLKGSVHRSLNCLSCHQDAEAIPHPPHLAPVDCTGCHDAPEAEYSRHGRLDPEENEGAPRCADCHGTHDIRRKNDPTSKIYPINVVRTCGACHQHYVGESLEPASQRRGPFAAYMESVHGRAVKEKGLVVAATCIHCHGHHDVRPSADPRARTHRANVPDTCGKCHLGIRDIFNTSVHAEAAAGDRIPSRTTTPPVCNDCHPAHRVLHVDTPAFLHDIVAECGACHQDLYRTYRESYHGQVQRLGSTRAAKCSDCHGSHDIRPLSDPNSRVAAQHLPDTCGKCHTQLAGMPPRARANFVEYRPHADYHDRRRDPVLYYIWIYFLILMGVTFTFWGLHSAAWFMRGALERRAASRRVHPGGVAPAPVFERFNAWHRWTHALVIVSFFGLTLTGLPLKFSDQGWADSLMRVLGGTDRARIAHRFFALLMFAYVVMHLIHLARAWRQGAGTLRQRVFGPNSMLPLGRDWRQFVQMLRWFFGRGPKPTFDRWTYWEKFDYWADAVGTVIIGGSGLLLWFPAFFATILSGYWFNIATIVHGYEALLAIVFIFTIHFFNAHLRWDKFPVDPVIFTGQISADELRAERGLQYDRLRAAGRLDELQVPPAPRWQWRLARVVGPLALLIGYVLVALIIWAGVAG